MLQSHGIAWKLHTVQVISEFHMGVANQHVMVCEAYSQEFASSTAHVLGPFKINYTVFFLQENIVLEAGGGIENKFNSCWLISAVQLINLTGLHQFLCGEYYHILFPSPTCIIKKMHEIF